MNVTERNVITVVLTVTVIEITKNNPVLIVNVIAINIVIVISIVIVNVITIVYIFIMESQRAKRASEALRVGKIDTPSSAGNLILTPMQENPLSEQTPPRRGVASHYKPTSYAIESCQHSHKIFRFHVVLPSLNRKALRKQKKKKTFWICNIYCDISGILK